MPASQEHKPVSPWRRAKALLSAYTTRSHLFLYRAAERTWGGRPLRVYRRARDLVRPALEHARVWINGAPQPAAPQYQPPPAFAALPRVSVETEQWQASLRDAAAGLGPYLDAPDVKALLGCIADVAQPAASLLRAEILARGGDGERALGLLWSAPPPHPLHELGLTALAPLARERLAALRADGDQALSVGHAARASERYRLALALDPECGATRRALARALTAQGRAAEAHLMLQRLAAGLDGAAPG